MYKYIQSHIQLESKFPVKWQSSFFKAFSSPWGHGQRCCWWVCVASESSTAAIQGQPTQKAILHNFQKKCPNTTHINNSFLNRSRVGRNKQVKKQNKNACWKKFKKIGQFKKLTSREHVSDWRLTSSRDQLIQDGGAYLALHLNLLLVEPCFSSIAWNHTSP